VKRLTIECLCCGQRRVVLQGRPGSIDEGECERCGYLGWAPAAALSERARTILRLRPPEQRRLAV
jgi:hypothetical protein